MIKKVILLISFPIFNLFAQNELSIEDAISIGLKNNFDIQISRLNFENSKNNARLGTSGFLPTLDASGNLGTSKSNQETNSPFSFGNSVTNSYGAQIALNWTLFDGFKMFVDNRRYEELTKLGEYQSKSIIEANVVNIAKMYYNAVQQELLLDVLKSTVEISRIRFEKVKMKNEIGGASSSDVLNSEVSLNNDLSNLLNQKLNYELAIKNLNLALGLSADNFIDVKNEISFDNAELNIDEIKQKAKDRNSLLLIARQNKMVASHLVESSKSNYYPKLLLNGSYGYRDQTTSSDSPRFAGDVTTKSTDGSLGLTLSFNLFNGLRNDIDIQSKMIDLDIQSLALKKVENELIGNLIEKFATYKIRMETVQLQSTNLKAAKRNLQLQMDKFNSGAINSLEFRDAQVNLAQAETNLITAKFQAKISILEIQQLAGEIVIQ
ncbi:MAG: TolC family protein [Melioribacteraceae bacterium]|nr:TolC family protein [Melioribacteraceae bacterium]MCF8264592.1 TolC family protein [Melioribacteraceae bacterium]MCF8432687.1 TolC family protein [Melioribacteraceae bacterium]